ncbi:hypothetical protein BI364_09565 [Acidihalobacter yilgarnensis]|uniref:Diiron oxygenase n=2 Tax=Acidihalobacter yilgarnensis TaxID=2819280 RepID=A0A1D8ITE2_9GAMM|nr:hypothetical protein BI364_09505 [Acidihalobacter yilgarnensis]AOU99657.1 hypothetical protein BI364_09565 [Acidihalobacter yilgarnensis]
MVAQASALTEQLNRSSNPYRDPLSRIDWQSLDLDHWWLPEAAVSLHGIPAYDHLPEAQRKRLSQYEFINFIEKALWLEGIFMERISRALADSLGQPSETLYRLHELREEAGHSLMFMELIQRSGLPIDPAAFKRPRLATWVGRHAPYRSAAFWIAVLIGEQVPDHMNRMIRKHRAQISDTIYEIITLHAIDEARHIVHARATLEYCLPIAGRLAPIYLPLLNHVFRQFVEAFYFPAPALYQLAGLDQPARWAQRAHANTARITFVDECVASTLRQLAGKNLPISWR